MAGLDPTPKPTTTEEADAVSSALTRETVDVPADEIPPDSPLDSSAPAASVPLDPNAQHCALVDLNLLSGSSE